MNQPIRVLQIVGRMDRGGIESFVMNLYRNIDRDRVQFDFLAHYGKEAEYNDEIRSMGGKIYEMPAIRNEKHVYYWKALSYICALNSFFKEHHYSILHGQMTNTASIYMPIAEKNGVATRIAHSHTSHGKEGILGLATNVLQISTYKYATDYFACSEKAAKFLFPKSLLKNDKVKIIPNAIDSARFRYNEDIRQKVRSDLGITNKMVIGAIGRFRKEKNQIFLPEVLKEVLAIEPNAILLFIGDGPLEDEVKQKANELGVANNTVFLGSRSNVADYMQAIDVMAMPSIFEGLPVVGIEAQAAGLPIVASKGITQEMNILGLVDFLSLEEDKKYWAEEIVEKAQKKRKDTYSEIKAAGYDIKETASMIQDFYIRKYSNSVGK